MNVVGRYIEYLKDNPERYWFKRKLYGWGWTPATREGWATLAFFIAVYAWLLVSFLKRPEPTDTDVFRFFAEISLWVALLIGVCYKTGEPPKWQWGIPGK